MKNRILLLVNSMLASIMALLGFHSCEVGMDEYGCPYGDYIVEGYVLDESDAPIEGIVVETYAGEYQLSELVTDSEGKFSDRNSYISPGNYKLVAKDTADLYASDTLKNAHFVKTKNGDGDWYEGEYKIEHTFHLKKK